MGEHLTDDTTFNARILQKSLQQYDNQPCESCPDGKTKIVGFAMGMGLVKGRGTCGVRSVISEPPTRQKDKEDTEEDEDEEDTDEDEDREEINLRAVLAAREAGLDYDGLGLYYTTLGYPDGMMAQGVWDDCVQILEREGIGAKKEGAKQEEGPTEPTSEGEPVSTLDTITKGMDELALKPKAQGAGEGEGANRKARKGKKEARRRKKHVQFCEIHYRMVKAALAVGLSREGLEKLNRTMGIFGDMPEDLWDACVAYIEGGETGIGPIPDF